MAKHTIERFVAHYQQKGTVITVPPKSIIRFAISVVFGLVMTTHIVAPELEWDDEEEIELTVRMIMHGLAR